MYLSQAISAIPSLPDATRSLLPRRGTVSFPAERLPYANAENFYPESFQYNQLPPALEAYYQQHLHKMIPPKQKAEYSIDVLNFLIQQQDAISVEALAQIIDTDEYEVEKVLQNWLEFLQQQRITTETHYSLYHSNFRDWLGRQQLKPS